MVKNLLLVILLTVVCAVDYESEIQPIWDINCSGCHMYPNTYGGLDLSSYEALMQGANSGPVIIPGFHAVSSLYDRITREQSQPGNMPPAGSLSDSDIQISRITVTPNPDSAIGLADSDFGFTSVITLIGDSS